MATMNVEKEYINSIGKLRFWTEETFGFMAPLQEAEVVINAIRDLQRERRRQEMKTIVSSFKEDGVTKDQLLVILNEVFDR